MKKSKQSFRDVLFAHNTQPTPCSVFLHFLAKTNSNNSSNVRVYVSWLLMHTNYDTLTSILPFFGWFPVRYRCIRVRVCCAYVCT